MLEHMCKGAQAARLGVTFQRAKFQKGIFNFSRLKEQSTSKGHRLRVIHVRQVRKSAVQVAFCANNQREQARRRSWDDVLRLFGDRSCSRDIAPVQREKRLKTQDL